MAITTEGKIGIALALAIPIAGAVSVVAPESAKPLAWTVIVVCSLGLVALGAHHASDLWRRRIQPGEGAKMLSFVGLVLCLMGAAAFGAWHFWPSAPGQVVAITPTTVTFGYENNSDYQEEIPFRPNGKAIARRVIFVKVFTQHRLDAASVSLLTIQPISEDSDSPKISYNPLRSSQQMNIGWFDAPPKCFQPRAIVDSNKFIPFNILKDGAQLALFTDTNSVEQSAVFNDIPVGEYRVVFGIEDRTLDHLVKVTYDMKWSGGWDGFQMKQIP